MYDPRLTADCHGRGQEREASSRSTVAPPIQQLQQPSPVTAASEARDSYDGEASPTITKVSCSASGS